MQVRSGWCGRYFEDFEVGDVYQHRRGRTITETDNTWFTLLTLNTNQLHYNADYAQRSEFGRVLVNSGFTIGLLLGMTVQDVSENAIANLGMDEIRLTHPVFVGDTLYGETLVLATRESASRPHAGIVTVRSRALNQDGEVCIVYRRSVMVHKRDGPHHEDAFPQATRDWSFGE